MVKYLVEHGADVHYENGSGFLMLKCIGEILERFSFPMVIDERDVNLNTF